jgi:hypothetical protein
MEKPPAKICVGTHEWRLARRSLPWGVRTLVMGVLNVTPDSFSDGGRFYDPARAAEHAARMVEEGADIIDVGGESTRPGSMDVSADEEIRRVVPVVEVLAALAGVPVSVDTTKAGVARAALGAGAEIVNDISGLRFEPALADEAASAGAGLEDALAAVRLIDATHLARVRELHDTFYATWRLEERGAIAGHREEVRGLLATAECLLIAGGHVGDLLRVLHVFHVAPHLPPRVVAWSAGAMVLTSRVVLFHDRAAHGRSLTEVFDAGLDVAPGLVLLPHARRRLRTDDHLRMSVLARRFAPATCLVLDDGVRVDLGPDGALPPDARLLGADGRITEGTAA